MSRWNRGRIAAVFVLAGTLGSGWPAVSQTAPAPSKPSAPDEAAPRELKLSPAAAPAPALRYRLMPLESERVAGDAAPIYLRIRHELNDESLRCVEAAFAALASGQAVVPPPMALDVPERQGEVHIKSARMVGAPSMAVKIVAGVYDNPKIGLPMSSGLVIVMSAETGALQAVLLDNGYLTEVRTGLAGAIAAKYAAPQHVDTVGMIGVGSQARYQWNPRWADHRVFTGL